MNKRDQQLCTVLSKELTETGLFLPALENLAVKEVLVKQLIDSVRRVTYALKVKELNNITQASASTDKNCFDPIKAAVFYNRQGNMDEAVWLIFLSIHFGYSSTCRWLLVEDFYRGVGGDIKWNWKSILNKGPEFDYWVQNFHERIKILSPKRKFGNHRKYESLKVSSNRSLPKVINSYKELIVPYGDHKNLFDAISIKASDCKYKKFEYLYSYFNNILSFGRTANFDFLAMIGKLGITDIEPPKTYVQGSTGPIDGARLLFGIKNEGASALEKKLAQLNKKLSIDPFGMQVLEDALCNWQKSPSKYVNFKG